MSILFLHDGGHVEGWLARALGQRREISELRSDRAFHVGCREIPSLPVILASEPVFPSMILHCTDRLLPKGLEQVPIPTVCVLVDVFVGLRHRLHWAMLFDYVFVSHPGFVRTFQAAGHPNVYCLPLAAPDSYLGTPGDDTIRHFDVGWVGRSEGPLFTARARILPRLADRFQMNDWRRWHSYDETSDVFRHSKIVVNVSRDDHPSDANMRVFEAMGAGALLITRLPTELTEMGFREGEHFVGYRDEDEVEVLVNGYLGRREERLRIAQRGMELVRGEHTYAHRAQRILDVIERDGPQLISPARHWSAAQVSLAYLRYYCVGSSLRFSAEAMRSVFRASKRSSLKGLPLFAKACMRHVQGVLSQ